MKVSFALGAVVAGLLMFGALKATADTPGPIEQAPAFGDAHAANPRVDSAVARVMRLDRTRGLADALNAARDSEIKAGRGAVRLELERSASTTAVERAVSELGGKVELRYGALDQVVVPVRSLARLASSPAVAYLRAPLRDYPDAVQGEGVAASGALSLHTQGITGAGVKIAVIDGGFRGWKDSQARGDLPASLTTQNYCPGTDFDGPDASDHGTAVAEIVHEVAPDAQLYLVCAETLTAYGNAVNYVEGQHVQVVNHSASFINAVRGDGKGGPTTPDGMIAGARASGILWVNAAGNYATSHWSGTFSDTDGDGAHNFAPDDEGDSIYVPAGEERCVFLKWDAWPTTNQDYDLLITQSSTGVVVAGSTADQTGSQPPTEATCFTNPGPDQYFAIFIVRYAATQSPRFDLVVPDENLQYAVAAGSIVEMAAPAASFAAAAVCWQDSSLQFYSSRGPTIDGRVKPDIAGFDGVSGLYGPAKGCTGGFLGTSAASPHVAGAAALVKQMNPTFGPDDLQSYLQSHAVDLGSPGFDNDTGAGKLALDFTPPETTLATGPAAQTSTTEPEFTFTASEAGSSFRCSLDGAEASPCTSPKTYSTLPDGAHVFDVAAVDLAGNVDPTPAHWAWTVDTVPPNTGLTAHPKALTRERTATVTFFANEDGAHFECRLDGAAFAACSSPQTLSGLANGKHQYEVRAIDGAGNTDSSPAAIEWTVDASAPVARALASAGQARRQLFIRYRVTDNSRRSRETITIRGGGKTIATIATREHEALGAVSRVEWRTSRTGTLRFCVNPTDPAGNHGRPGCNALVVH